MGDNGVRRTLDARRRQPQTPLRVGRSHRKERRAGSRVSPPEQVPMHSAYVGRAHSPDVNATSPAQDENLHALLTVDDVAALLKVSKSWVYEHTRARGAPRSQRLPYVKVGKYIRFEPRAVRAFIDQQCRTTP